MKNSDKTREQFLKDLEKSKKRIAELEKSETEFKKTEEELENIFNLSPDLVGVFTTAGKLLKVNPSWEKVLGYTPKELLDMGWTKLVHPDEVKRTNKEIDKQLKGSVVEDFVNRYKCKDGSYKTLEWKATFAKDGIVHATARDITERKQVEDALRISEERWQFALEGSGDGVWDWSIQLNEVFFSKQWKAMLGFKEDEISGNLEEWDKRIHPDDIEKVHEDIQKHLDGKTPVYENEHRIQCKDGSCKWIYSRGKVISRSEKGKPLRMIGTHSDINKSKEIEEKLAKHREHLEELVKERTLEVERSQKSLVLLLEDVNEINQELENVNTMLDATNKELEAFSFSVSHDLRAPLTRMDGFSNVLLTNYSDKLDDQGIHYLNRIKASSQHMAKLIDDLISLSRITREEVYRQKVDLSQITVKITEGLKAFKPGRKVNFEIAKGLRADADSKFVEIVLKNLLGNAFKFTGNQKNAIIGFGMTTIDDKEVFFIKDNGAGFNMKYYDKIFIAFQRLHSDEEFKGTGIGLAIVQRIINKHGGKIWAESEEDKGTTFYFRFE